MLIDMLLVVKVVIGFFEELGGVLIVEIIGEDGWEVEDIVSVDLVVECCC